MKIILKQLSRQLIDPPSKMRHSYRLIQSTARMNWIYEFNCCLRGRLRSSSTQNWCGTSYGLRNNDVGKVWSGFESNGTRQDQEERKFAGRCGWYDGSNREGINKLIISWPNNSSPCAPIEARRFKQPFLVCKGRILIL